MSTPAAKSAAKPFDGLPDILREIAEIAGLDAAMKLAWAYGGLKVKIPRRAGQRHWLVECVGRKAADAICAHFCVHDADGKAIGNFRVNIPLAGTGHIDAGRRRLAKDLEDGKMSVPAAARRAGFSERTAWRLKARLASPGGDRQSDLFATPPKS